MRTLIILLSTISLFFSTFFGGKSEEEITFFLVGDSTMADKPYGVSNPEKGWGQVFPLYFKEGIRFENHAMNGRSTKSFRAEGRWDVVMDRLKEGDYVIVEFGHNDQKINSADRYAFADSTYRDNLIRFVNEVREKGGKAVLATPISRRSFDENGVLTDTHGRYSEVVREVAAEMEVPLFDLHKKTVELLEQWGVEKSKELFLHFKPGEYEKFPKGVEDNTHLSPTGAFKVSDLAIKELKRELPELMKFLKD
ncbi:lysophospholipase L1-like esterase [Algoriphagus iocasae]|uniref:Lysophospholipase L1-like esterase n=1 Tax=Algoriphagus iocasae TaxID=1836499 RepID=A0A841MPW0_9BACT|nr:rhamnogalacturonan acetylesterase [Algoriphagus iocasae]MBB6324595.1 lysophospholipase L1-like esterase [Algoriphagus iocasae]